MKIQRNLTSIALSTLTLIVFSVSIAGAESGINNRQIFVGTSARALGMGSALTAGPASSDSLFWNPSSLGFLNATELSLVGLPFAQASDDREGAFSLALNRQQLGISATNVGSVSLSSWFDGWGDDDEKNRMMLVGYGLPLGKEFAAGASIRHHRRSRSIREQFGWSFDLGVLFAHKLERFGAQIALGLTFEDLGGHIWENGQLIEKMPPVTRLGTAYHLDRNTILSGDFVLHNDTQIDFEERLRTHVGVERWLFQKRFGLRLGYTAIANANRFTEGEWSTGLSLHSGSGQLDYAYVRGNELDGAMHWLSATLRWGGRTAEPPVSQPPISEAPTPPPTQPAPIVMPTQIFSVLHVSEKAISPNGDGVKDQAAFDFEIAEEDAWQLEIRDDAHQGDWGEIVQTYSGTGLPSMEIVWEGQDDEGNPVSDGTYTARWFTLDEGGTRRLQSETTIIVDTTPASLDISAEPPILAPADAAMPGGETVLNMPTVHVQTSDLNPIVRWELQFFNGRAPVEHLHEDGEPPDTIVWNNWRSGQSAVSPNADYRCVLAVHDIAGNRSTHEASFSVIKVERRDQGDGQGAVVEAPREDKQVWAAPPENAPELVLTLPGVAFESNAYEIKSEYRPTLEKVVQTIAAYPDAQAIIEGHTDNTGESSYNLELSRRRANAVMVYLVREFGANPAQLSAIGYGEERPIAPNDTKHNRQKNRRVEIVLSAIEGASPPAEKMKAQTMPSDGPKATGDASAVTPKYTLLVSSFKNRENAELLVESLEALGLGEEVRVDRVIIRSEPWYRVTIGRFHDRKDAAGLISQIKAQGVEPLVISAARAGK